MDYRPPDFSMAEYRIQCYQQLPPDIRARAVGYLQGRLDASDRAEIHNQFAEHGIKWYTPHHHGWGRVLRNELRNEAGILDEELPSGNWDDYVAVCIEVACGIREPVSGFIDVRNEPLDTQG
jgi:hypothetical protein